LVNRFKHFAIVICDFGFIGIIGIMIFAHNIQILNNPLFTYYAYITVLHKEEYSNIMATSMKPHHLLPGPHLRRPGEVVRSVLQASRLLPLIGCMCLVRFIELSQELNLGHQ